MTEPTLYSRVFALDDISIRAGGDGRTVTAYAAVFGSPAEIRDQDGHYEEQIARTAFDKTLKERAGRIGVFYNHAKTLWGTPSTQGSVPLGTPLEMRTDARGLLTVTRYNKTSLADDVLEAIRNGDITGQSFTGRFIKSDPRGPYLPGADGGLTLVTRQEIALIEYGPTPIPAYADAEIMGVRAGEPAPERESVTLTSAVADETAARTDEAPETALIEAGISPQEAATIAAAGTPGDAPADEGTPAADEGTEAAARAETDTEAAPEPQITHSAIPEHRSETEGKTMTDDRMTVEERAARQSEIRARLQEIEGEFSGSEMPQEIQSEWDGLLLENAAHARAIHETEQRQMQLRAVLDNPTAAERVDNRIAGFGGQAPAVITTRDIYDLTEARQQARSVEDLPGIYRDRAMRAIELSQFPGVENKEDAQTRASYLVDNIDDEAGTLARRMLRTGSPLYSRAFGKMMVALSANGLTAEESRALQLGVDGSGGFAVPFQLDPTVVLTSDGTINPLREVARVEQIVGKKWQGVNSAGVTVTRGAETDEAPDSSPTLTQPEVGTNPVQGFIPFTASIERSWNAMRSEMTMLLQDAKDTEEATAFVTGDGTGTNAGGIIATLGAGQRVGQSGAAGALTVPADVFKVEEALPPRFRARASWLANKSIYNKVRGAAGAAAGYAGDLWARLAPGQPPELIGYAARELSSMDGTIEATGAGANYVLLFGDYKRGFIIVDRIGMNVELVPHLFGSNGRPKNQRGIWAHWENNSKIIVPNALRVLNVVSPT